MNLATLAEIDPTFDRVAVGVVQRVLARVNKVRAYKHVHAAADERVPALQALLEAAFARGHAALSQEMMVKLLTKGDHTGLMIAVDMAITATANALHASDLHQVLLDTVTASGQTAFNHVKVAGRADQPRDKKGEWTESHLNKKGLQVKRHRDSLDKVIRSAADASIKDFSFDDTDPNAVEWAKQHAADLVQGISKASRNDIKQLVEDAFTEHHTADELAKEIEDVIGDPERADLIAHTETMTAANKGQQVAWSQAVSSGLLTGDEQQEWIATPDDRICPICESLDGQVVGLDDSFQDDSGEEYDGPPAHPRCRCTVGLSIAPVSAGAADQPRDSHGQFTVVNGTTYHQVSSHSTRAEAEQHAIARAKQTGNTYEVHDHGKLVSEHSPRGSVRAAWKPDQPRDPKGEWTSGGNMSARAKRALASHKPSTAAMQRHAESNERVVAKMVGGSVSEDTQSNAPLDVVKGKHGIEVKTLLNNSHDKITMHPPSRIRKEQWAAQNHAVVHTVVIDHRPGRANSGHEVYYKRGVGAFRLHTMTKVSGPAHLRKLMEAK